MYNYRDIKASAEFIKSKINEIPDIALVLGSGLGELAEEIEDAVIIDYGDIPGFSKSTVVGHKGRLIFGLLEGKRVVAMQGRYHYYEGHTQMDAVFPIRVLGVFGVKTLILTNAAGGTDKNFEIPTIMAIEDHINFSGSNPLIGANIDELGVRFPDMSNVYDKELRGKLKDVADKNGIRLESGVYMFFSGPSYETHAEIRAAITLGASAVGMSTVPEAIAAVHMGLRVVGVSCITNPAAGISKGTLNHEEVIEASAKASIDFKTLIRAFIRDL